MTISNDDLTAYHKTHAALRDAVAKAGLHQQAVVRRRELEAERHHQDALNALQSLLDDDPRHLEMPKIVDMIGLLFEIRERARDVK